NTATSRDPITRPTLRLIASSLRVTRSVGIWPQLPVVAEARPDARQPLGLVHQKEDDREPEHDVARRGDQPEGLRLPPGERRGGALENLGQERHEDGAEDRAEDAALAADDDHRQV